MSLLVPDFAATKFVLASVAFTAPVPPLATAKVPATVTAPVVVVDGVSPVVPKVIELTPEPAPENCAQVMAVTLIVPPALLVQTQPVSASVVPVSIKT